MSSRSHNMCTARRRLDGLTSFPGRSPAARRSRVPCPRDDALQPSVLDLELLQPAHVVGLHAAVLRAPPVIRLFADLEMPRDFLDIFAFTEQPVGLAQLA